MTKLVQVQEPQNTMATQITDRDFSRIAKIALTEFGLSLSPSKRALVFLRVQNRLRILNLPNIDMYCHLIESPKGAPELTELLSALTTNVTRFFREDHHFSHLKAKVLPGLLESARAGGRVRIWSAGCSSGQEPYSLAMTALQLDPEIGRFNFKILATDIDPIILNRAYSAVYSVDEVENVPEVLLNDSGMFSTANALGRYQVSKRVCDLVTFGVLNLISDFPLAGPFDVILCRNVAIYFNRPTQERLWQRFADFLVPGGYLYIGHSERLCGSAANLLHRAGTTTYRKNMVERGARAPIANAN